MRPKQFILYFLITLTALLSLPAHAQQSYMEHSADYLFDGNIYLIKQAGHICNTGAEMRQEISGEGLYEKLMDIEMIKSKIIVSDDNTFITDPDALDNLEVTTTIELCTPPKYGILNRQRQSRDSLSFNGATSPIYGDLTDQIWASSISADPGHLGQLSAEFTAAYGPEGDISNFDELLELIEEGYPFDPTAIRFDLNKLGNDEWAEYYEFPNLKEYIVTGPEYVGDYFNIEQFMHTTGGEAKRFIDISSSRAHVYLKEEMTATGLITIKDYFELLNLPAGSAANEDWMSLYTPGENDGISFVDEIGYLSQNTDYYIDGTIGFEKQAGHYCNTGAEMKQAISGDGELTKAMDIEMLKGYLAVNDSNEFTTSTDALNNMIVTSVIELCAPPKQELIESFGRRFSETLDISEQIWAVSVEANPGHSGFVGNTFEAAYGPDHMLPFANHNLDGSIEFEGFGVWWLIPAPSNSWWVSTDEQNTFPVIGKDYVGNYFTIEQLARTTDGVLKRYIDISSPWNHSYIYENATIIGQAEVKEAFIMDSLPPGSSVDHNWWSLYSSGGSPEEFTPLYDYYLPEIYFYYYNLPILLR